MDLETKNKANNDSEEEKFCDEDGWMVVSPNKATLPPLPASPEFELVCDKDQSIATKAVLKAKRKRSKKDITKSYAVVKPEEVPCKDWHSCEKCFSSLIDNIPYIDEGEEELYSRTLEGATASSHCANHPAEGPIRGKRSKIKRSTAMYQIYEADEGKENRKMGNANDKSVDEYEVMANEYIYETDRSEKERKIQNDIESSSLKYDYWDSYPKHRNLSSISWLWLSEEQQSQKIESFSKAKNQGIQVLGGLWRLEKPKEKIPLQLKYLIFPKSTLN